MSQQIFGTKQSHSTMKADRLSASAVVARWRPTRLDLTISLAVAPLLPLIAGFLYRRTGALIPMVLYYGLAWALVMWRRGSSGYGNPRPAKITGYFYLNVFVIIACLVSAYLARIRYPAGDATGILVTALVWAPINAASEQLLWIYLFESWDLYPEKPSPAFRFVGLLLFLVFVGLIHALFWARFLTTVDPSGVLGAVFIVLTSLSGFLHLVVWRKSNHMILTFIPHFMLNLIPLFWTGYSMLPYLLKTG